MPKGQKNDRAIATLADDIGAAIRDSRLGNNEAIVACMLVVVERLVFIEDYHERKAAYDEARSMLASSIEIANKAHHSA
jgi:hypothetical protein